MNPTGSASSLLNEAYRQASQSMFNLISKVSPAQDIWKEICSLASAVTEQEYWLLQSTHLLHANEGSDVSKSTSLHQYN